MSKTVLSRTIQFSIKQFYFKLFVSAWVRSLNVETVVFQTIRCNISTLFKCQTVLFQAIQLSVSTEFSFIWPTDMSLSETEWTRESMNEYSAFPKLQVYWNLTIRLFNGISRTLVNEVSSLCRKAAGVICSPLQLTGQKMWLTRKVSISCKIIYV